MVIWRVPWKRPTVCGHVPVQKTLSAEFFRSRIGERGEHLRSAPAYVAQALSQELNVSVPELDVIGCGRTGFEPDGLADHERGGLRFGLADSARCGSAAIAPVQEFVRLCCAQHKHIYVAMKFMWRSASIPA